MHKNVYTFQVTNYTFYTSYHMKIFSKDSTGRICWMIMNDPSNEIAIYCLLSYPIMRVEIPFDHFFAHIDFLVTKNMLSVHSISLSRSSDGSDENFMILVIVANKRLIDWTKLIINKGWGSDQKDRTKQNSYTDATLQIYCDVITEFC